MIKMQVIGRLGKDCLVNNVNGKNVINFTVAHSERYRDSQGNQQEKTMWIDCAYWTEKTAVAPYLVKGVQVFAEGQPEVRSFTRNDGTTGATLSLRVRELQLLGSKSEGSVPPSPTGTTTVAAPSISDVSSSANVSEGSPIADVPADDLPF